MTQLFGIKIETYSGNTLLPNAKNVVEYLGETEKSYKYRIGQNGMVRYLNKEVFKMQGGKLLIKYKHLGEILLHDGCLSDLECSKILTESYIDRLENILENNKRILDAVIEEMKVKYN